MARDQAKIRSLEERAFNAWPALATVMVDGWVLRFADGYTKRANSVNAWQPLSAVEAVHAVAAPLYAGAGLPMVFRLSPLAPVGADAALAALGLRHADDTRVMTSAIPSRFEVDPAVTLASRPEPAWAHGFAEANRVPARHRATHDRLLEAIRFPVAFGTLSQDGKAIAWGIAVLERGMVGLFDVVTAPSARRQGAGERLVTSLMAWGRELGAGAAYLQVVAGNAAAIRLYERLGFQDAYRYHYRIEA